MLLLADVKETNEKLGKVWENDGWAGHVNWEIDVATKLANHTINNIAFWMIRTIHIWNTIVVQEKMSIFSIERIQLHSGSSQLPASMQQLDFIFQFYHRPEACINQSLISLWNVILVCKHRALSCLNTMKGILLDIEPPPNFHCPPCGNFLISGAWLWLQGVIISKPSYICINASKNYWHRMWFLLVGRILHSTYSDQRLVVSVKSEWYLVVSDRECLVCRHNTLRDQFLVGPHTVSMCRHSVALSQWYQHQSELHH